VDPRFTSDTLKFLRALNRHNDREWFRARRDEYERQVRAPMVAVIEQLARDFRRFAPEMEASPKTSLYRIYRDTRFSEDKSPLKTHIAASFSWRGLPRGESAGLYVEVHPQWVWMGGGFYAPETAHLVRIREHIAETYPEIHRIARAAAFRRAVSALDGERLARVPRGFARDHPAAEYLQFRTFLAGREFEPALATSARFYPTLVGTFRAVMPLVRFLNEALVTPGEELKLRAPADRNRSAELKLRATSPRRNRSRS
jgi:uncharacterized protein (TIGR02453 family)